MALSLPRRWGGGDGARRLPGEMIGLFRGRRQSPAPCARKIGASPRVRKDPAPIHLVKLLTVDETSNYHMATRRGTRVRIPTGIVSPHAGTAVWPPDALVPGVSPREEGLGMDEPSRSARRQPLSFLVATALPLTGNTPFLRRGCLRTRRAFPTPTWRSSGGWPVPSHPSALQPPFTPAQADQGKLRLFPRWSRVIVRLAQGCPPLSIVGDLHWAGWPALGLPAVR
jgi:hypothetical protein